MANTRSNWRNMKRFVMSLVAAGSVAASPLLAASPAFATSEDHHKGGDSTESSTVCSNGGLLQLQVVCIGTIAIPVVIDVLSGNQLFTNESIDQNKPSASAKTD